MNKIKQLFAVAVVLSLVLLGGCEVLGDHSSNRGSGASSSGGGHRH